ncbi:unnamed protein product, partial [Staurois parvus]
WVGAAPVSKSRACTTSGATCIEPRFTSVRICTKIRAAAPPTQRIADPRAVLVTTKGGLTIGELGQCPRARGQ